MKVKLTMEWLGHPKDAVLDLPVTVAKALYQRKGCVKVKVKDKEEDLEK